MNIGKYIQMYSDDLKFKGYSENTIENYRSQVAQFLKYHEAVATKPSEISERQVKAYIMLAQTTNSRKHRLSAIKLFYKLTGKQPMKLDRVEYPRSEKKLPIPLSVDEVQKMFAVCENLKHKTILALLYSTGMRVSELLSLRWKHIDRSRMVINIISAKGKKDRQVMLSAQTLTLLEKYYRQYKTPDHVIEGQGSDKYSATSVRMVVKALAKKAGIRKRVYTHLMRHNCFTHMVEAGTDINLIQKIAGHNNPKTTMIYTHISDALISRINSPMESIKL